MQTSRAPSETPRWAPWVLVAITVAAAWLRLPGLTAEEPWFDEVFSIVLASQDPSELCRRAIADETNPPGFYFLLWGWTRLGGFDLAWMRLLPLLAATLTVPATAFAARASGLGWTGAVVAASLAASSPLMFAMSSELRAYAPLALAAALTLAAAAQHRTRRAALGGVVLVMLHYFGAFVVAALAIATLWAGRARWRGALRAAVSAALPAALVLGAWVLTVMSAAGARAVGSNASWIAEAGPSALLGFASQVLGTFGTLAGTTVVAAVLVTTLVVALRTLGAHTAARQQLETPTTSRRQPVPGEPNPLSTPDLRFALLLALLPIVSVALLSALSQRELWLARYLIITLPGWCVLLGYATERVPDRWRAAALAALLTWSAFTGLHAEATRTPRTSWSLVARALAASGPRTVCTAESYVALPLRYQALRERLTLTVLDLADCTAARAPSAMILRAGTEAALSHVVARGARSGATRDLGTRLPATVLVPLTWQAARASR